MLVEAPPTWLGTPRFWASGRVLGLKLNFCSRKRRGLRSWILRNCTHSWASAYLDDADAHAALTSPLF